MKLTSHFLLGLMIAGSSAIAQSVPVAPKRVDELITIPLDQAEGHLIRQEPPRYPPVAKAARIEGAIHLTLQVDTDGAVTRVVQSSGHPLLVRAAIETAEGYRYQPFQVNGATAEVLVEAVVNFSLQVQPPPHIPFPEITNLASVVIAYSDGSISVRVSGNGIVEYDGRSRVVVEGKHERRIQPEEVQQLLKVFQGADFYSLLDDYSVSATDVGTTTTSIRVGTLVKTISDNWVQVPPILKGVQDAILKYSHSDQWVKGNSDTISSLLAETPDPAAKRKILSEVLPRAALYSDSTVVNNILANPVDLEHHGPYDATALLLAADRGLPDMVASLLKAGANPHATDGDGRGALIFGAGSGNAEVVRLLLSAGLKGDEKDKYGDTALMAAAASGNPESVRLLLANGARVNQRNSRRQTALLSATTGDPGFSIGDMGRRHAEIPEDVVHRDAVVRILLDAGADINVRGWFGETALFSLDDDAVQELLRHRINLEIRDNSGETALIDTVSASIADLLIKAGANVNARNKNGETALIKAAKYNHVAKVEVLLKAPGIQIEQRDNRGETALMKAKAAHHDDCVRLLMEVGATF